MNKISTEELEQKIAAGEEVIDRYFDPASTRVGTRRVLTSRRGQDQLSNDHGLELPDAMLGELSQLALELQISRDAVIKMMLRRALDEHHLAKRIGA
jgi:hypothetical protein